MNQKKTDKAWFFVGTVLTCFVVMVLVMTTSLFIYHQITTSEDAVETMANIKNEDTVTLQESASVKGQLKNILTDSEAVTKELGEIGFLSQLKQGLESGTDMLTLLRSFYPNEIVVASGDRKSVV